jgi:hypothetical protein
MRSKKGDQLMSCVKRLLACGALTVVVMALLGSGTAGARGSRESGGLVVSSPAGRCPGWHVIPSPNPNPTPGAFNILYGVTASSPTAAWAVGQGSDTGLIERWTGRGWSLVPNPYFHQTQTLYGVSAVSATDVWAVGNYITLRTTPPLTLHWNGARWQQVPAPLVGVADTLTGVAALSASDVWAVGYTSTVFDVTSTLIEHWDGTSWQVVPSPNPPGGGGLNAVTMVPGTDQLWAVGSYLTTANISQTLIEQWNGTAWQIVPSPNGGADANDLYGVAAVAARDVWAVGEAVVPHTGPSQPLLERWDGMRWQVVAGPIPGKIYNTLQGVTVIPGTSRLWAVGAYANTGPGPSETLTELYC